MYRDINERLSEYKQEILRVKNIDLMLESLHKEYINAENQLESAKKLLDKENSEYEKLAGKSFSTVLYSILGKLEDKTEKERQEAVQAQLSYNRILKNINDIKGKIANLEDEKYRYRNSETDYQKLYDEKLRLLMLENGSTAQIIMELENDIENSKANQKEIREAYEVGLEVEKTIEDGLSSLNSAAGWGTWDLFGGGLLTDVIKHSHINDADVMAQKAQSLMRSFRTELADIHIDSDIKVDISSFAVFADYFFDGIFADWYMLDRINETQNNFNDILSQVQKMLDALNEMDIAENGRQKMLLKQIDDYVIEK
ncbi:MAG: hypothetical protein GXZ08_09440 [Tissierellia bacterium]|nr:hypothetical protein [Tissierellia bacterium]